MLLWITLGIKVCFSATADISKLEKLTVVTPTFDALYTLTKPKLVLKAT